MATMNLQELAAQFNIEINPKPITLELATPEEQKQTKQEETLNVWGCEPSDWAGKMSRLQDILPICFYDHKPTQQAHMMVLKEYRIIRNRIQCAPSWIRSTNKFSSLHLPYEGDVINLRVDKDLEHLDKDLEQASKTVKNIEAQIKNIEELPDTWKESTESFYSHRDPFTDEKDYGVSSETKRFKRPKVQIDANAIRLNALKSSLVATEIYANNLQKTIKIYKEELQDLYIAYLENTLSGTEV
tara:strand:- start:340 stop:1068 length:729 start_codon:yes stop_codon:yes gene_type:complete